MKILGFHFLTISQIKFLNKYVKPRWNYDKDKWVRGGKWTINKKTGLVDIKGNFNCSGEGLTDFKGVLFGVVTGDFYCSNNKLTSLEGAPQVVGGSFYCFRNKLTSLEGAPQEVEEDFHCFSNNLTSLEGAPQEVGGNFYCSYNKLTSLVGAPQVVGRNFYCDNNPISEKTLKLVWNTMKKNKIDYWSALCVVKSEIPDGYWKRMSRGLDEILTKDTQKGISMLGRFGHFD